MEQREVTVIKARPKFDLDKNGFKVIKKRVAAYARVGTDSDEQINSYKNQLDSLLKAAILASTSISSRSSALEVYIIAPVR